ncbi:MAG: hypothetical protein FWE88_08675 [Phycisphaerae bacterium]|nr:hypothetical protein [Phycisphaerae bacterium]
MRLILLDIFSSRHNFFPLALGRPVWELRCGIRTLAEKLQAASRATSAAGFTCAYLAATARAESDFAVNDLAALWGDDLLLVNARVKADALADWLAEGPEEALALSADGEFLAARVARATAARINPTSIEAFLRHLMAELTPVDAPACWDFAWNLVHANAEEITADFAAMGLHGQGRPLESGAVLRGSPNDLYIADNASVAPMTVLDATNGPILIGHGASVEPFTHIEGPCYVGPHTRLLGAKIRHGNTFGPHCRIGGEVEASIFQGYANKAHEGFIGHAYVGQWVNFGALTTNSDLRNDYGNVRVRLDDRGPLHTGMMKFGALVGDHTKTSIGTLLNTGAYIGAFCVLVTGGELCPRFVPSFSTYYQGHVNESFTRDQLYRTARTVLPRRQRIWTPDMETLWNAVYELTAADRTTADMFAA